jgi:DNA-binding transcriptional ArsR family regulator
MNASNGNSQASNVTTIMATLGDPTRRGLYEEIVRTGELSVIDLTRKSTISQPAVSQHLKALRLAGLVVERREGRRSLYRPQPAGLAPLFDWLDHYSTFWTDRVSALRSILKEIDPK